MINNKLFILTLLCVLLASRPWSNVHAKTMGEYLVEVTEQELFEEEQQSWPQKERLIEQDNKGDDGLTRQKNITITVKELKDNSGLVYLGGLVSKAEISAYLATLKLILGDKYTHYRENQARRDHRLFHLTLINPYEYQHIDKTKIVLGQKMNVTLLGVGQVSKDQKESFFVVAQSSQADLFRQRHVLSVKDFHVTLGFSPEDIYNTSKGKETLINRDNVK